MKTKFKSSVSKTNLSAVKEAARIGLYLLAIPFCLVAWILYTHPDTEPLYYLATAFIFLVLVVAAIYPFVKDVNELSSYFKNLLYRREIKMPVFSSFTAATQLPEVLSLLRKSWEETNRELNSKVLESRVVFNTIPNIIIILNSNLVVISANDAAHTTLGANLIGQDIEALVDNKNLVGLIRVAMHEKIGKTLDVILNDVMPKYYNVKIELLGSHNHELTRNILLVFDDVTETRRNEQTFSDFVTNASHEIRTPITTIIGITETLARTGYDDKEALEHFFPMVHSQAVRMNQLINDLLNLASLEKQVNKPLDELVDIREVIEFSAKQLEWEVGQSKNKFVLNFSEDVSDIIGDRNQLVQVFHNLLINAIKYGKPETDIIVNVCETSEFPVAHPSVVEYNKMLMISITDFGDGIAEENIERLTERFFRVDKSRSRKVGGTGLGLSIVKQILLRHQGFMEVKSVLKQGSTFVVYLPIYDNVEALGAGSQKESS